MKVYQKSKSDFRAWTLRNNLTLPLISYSLTHTNLQVTVTKFGRNKRCIQLMKCRGRRGKEIGAREAEYPVWFEELWVVETEYWGEGVEFQVWEVESYLCFVIWHAWIQSFQRDSIPLENGKRYWWKKKKNNNEPFLDYSKRLRPSNSCCMACWKICETS